MFNKFLKKNAQEKLPLNNETNFRFSFLLQVSQLINLHVYDIGIALLRDQANEYNLQILDRLHEYVYAFFVKIYI